MPRIYRAEVDAILSYVHSLATVDKHSVAVLDRSAEAGASIHRLREVMKVFEGISQRGGREHLGFILLTNSAFGDALCGLLDRVQRRRCSVQSHSTGAHHVVPQNDEAADLVEAGVSPVLSAMSECLMFTGGFTGASRLPPCMRKHLLERLELILRILCVVYLEDVTFVLKGGGVPPLCESRRQPSFEEARRVVEAVRCMLLFFGCSAPVNTDEIPLFWRLLRLIFYLSFARSACRRDVFASISLRSLCIATIAQVLRQSDVQWFASSSIGSSSRGRECAALLGMYEIWNDLLAIYDEAPDVQIERLSKELTTATTSSSPESTRGESHHKDQDDGAIPSFLVLRFKVANRLRRTAWRLLRAVEDLIVAVTFIDPVKFAAEENRSTPSSLMFSLDAVPASLSSDAMSSTSDPSMMLQQRWMSMIAWTVGDCGSSVFAEVVRQDVKRHYAKSASHAAPVLESDQAVPEQSASSTTSLGLSPPQERLRFGLHHDALYEVLSFGGYPVVDKAMLASRTWRHNIIHRHSLFEQSTWFLKKYGTLMQQEIKGQALYRKAILLPLLGDLINPRIPSSSSSDFGNVLRRPRGETWPLLWPLAPWFADYGGGDDDHGDDRRPQSGGQREITAGNHHDAIHPRIASLIDTCRHKSFQLLVHVSNSLSTYGQGEGIASRRAAAGASNEQRLLVAETASTERRKLWDYVFETLANRPLESLNDCLRCLIGRKRSGLEPGSSRAAISLAWTIDRDGTSASDTLFCMAVALLEQSWESFEKLNFYNSALRLILNVAQSLIDDANVGGGGVAYRGRSSDGRDPASPPSIAVRDVSPLPSSPVSSSSSSSLAKVELLLTVLRNGFLPIVLVFACRDGLSDPSVQRKAQSLIEHLMLSESAKYFRSYAFFEGTEAEILTSSSSSSRSSPIVAVKSTCGSKAVRNDYWAIHSLQHFVGRVRGGGNSTAFAATAAAAERSTVLPPPIIRDLSAALTRIISSNVAHYYTSSSPPATSSRTEVIFWNWKWPWIALLSEAREGNDNARQFFRRIALISSNSPLNGRGFLNRLADELCAHGITNRSEIDGLFR